MNATMIRRGMSLVVTGLVLIAMAAPCAADFDNDGYADLVVSAKWKSVDTVIQAGLVMEVDGGSGGITLTDRLWHQDMGLLEECDAVDLFGGSLAIGDFDGDGYQDLAVGVPTENAGGVVDAGLFHVIYGAGSGLTTVGNQIFSQEDATIHSDSENTDLFGFALAAADFNGDGFDDLAVGAPREDLDAIVDAGAVVVLFGTSGGLDSSGSQWIIQSDADGTNEAYDNFGESLVAGDFDGDGFADLAIGAPGEGQDGLNQVGHVNVMYGTASGLEDSSFNDAWHQNSIGISGNCEVGDRFGETLAAGDFNNDGRDDLVIGVPGEDVETGGDFTDAGMVHVIFGSTFGLASAGSQLLYQSSFGPNSSEDDDHFGYSLVAADFNGDGFEDLVIGTPDEDWGTMTDMGVIEFLPGSSSGVDWTASVLINEDHLDNDGVITSDEKFGFALAAGDIDGDGYNDLIVSAPYENSGGEADSGTVHVLYGTAAGLSMDNDSFDQCSADYAGDCEPDDKFGWALAALPKEAGPVDTPIFSDNFESGNLSAWDGTSP